MLFLVRCLLVTVLLATTVSLNLNSTLELGTDNEADDMSINQSRISSQYLPRCFQVTLQPDQFKYINDGKILVEVGYDIGPVSNYSYSKDNKSIDFCFPLSPQLQHCTTRNYSNGTYQIRNLTLYDNIQNNNTIAELGDYYVDNHGNAITCKENITKGRRIRCNYFTLRQGEYQIFNNGTLYSPTLKKIIDMPIFSLVDNRSQTLNLCYPLDISLLNCDQCRHEQLPSRFYELQADYTLYVPLWNFKVDLDGYYYKNYDDLDPYICRPSRTFRIAKWNSNLILIWIYKTTYVVSAFLLTSAALMQVSLPKLTSYDKCLLCHNISIAIFYIHAVFCWYNNYCDFPSVAICCLFFCIGYLTHLSIYCWLTVCAFDVWKSFNQLEMPQAINRFGLYSLFGLGIPLALCSLVLIINFTPTFMTFLALNFSIECMTLFIDNKSRLVFYTIPLMLIATINIGLFILTLCHIRGVISNVQIAKCKPKRQM